MKPTRFKKILVSGLMAIMALSSLTGCGGKGNTVNPTIEGITGPEVEIVNGKVLLSMTFKDITIDGGATIPIPKFPNSSVQVGPDFQSAGTLLVLTMDTKDFLGNNNGVVGFDPQTLPGGRPIPTVAAGSLPAVAIPVKQLFNTVFYVGPKVVGFFVPFNKLNLAGSILSFRFYDKAGAPKGILALVGADQSGKNAGIMALLSVDLMGIIKPSNQSTLNKLANLMN